MILVDDYPTLITINHYINHYINHDLVGGLVAINFELSHEYWESLIIP